MSTLGVPSSLLVLSENAATFPTNPWTASLPHTPLPLNHESYYLGWRYGSLGRKDWGGEICVADLHLISFQGKDRAIRRSHVAMFNWICDATWITHCSQRMNNLGTPNFPIGQLMTCFWNVARLYYVARCLLTLWPCARKSLVVDGGGRSCYDVVCEATVISGSHVVK